MSARERMRRKRQRDRDGIRLVTVEVDDLVLSETLAKTGDIDPLRDDDPAHLRSGFQRLINRLFTRYA